MANERTVIVCDDEQEVLNQLKQGLEEYAFAVSLLQNASQLVSEVQRSKPALVVVNPDMKGFDAPGVCRQIKVELGIPVVLLIDKNSTSRNTIDTCVADDVVNKPVDEQIIAFLLQNHFAIHSKNNKSSDALS